MLSLSDIGSALDSVSVDSARGNQKSEQSSRPGTYTARSASKDADNRPLLALRAGVSGLQELGRPNFALSGRRNAVIRLGSNVERSVPNHRLIAMPYRSVLLTICALVAASGCLNLRKAEERQRFGKSGFAELQQNAETAADNNLSGPRRSQNDSSNVVPAGFRKLERMGDRKFVPLEIETSAELPPREVSHDGSPVSQAPAGENGQPRSLPGSMGTPAGNPRTNPTATGQHLQLAPYEVAAERAVLLAQLLDKAQAEVRTLRERAATLEQQLEALQRSRPEELRELEQATSELSRARLEMEALHEEVASLRERLRQLDKQDLETLQEIIAALEQLVGDAPSPKTAH